MMKTAGIYIKTAGGVAFVLICNALSAIAPLAILCFALVLVDCLTSWQLAVRLKRQGKSTGKFRSDKFGRAVFDMAIIIPVALLIAHFVQLYIFEGTNIHLTNIIAGIISFWQIWSILENISSGQKNKMWATILQKVMIDKAERHFDVDLSELKTELKNIDNEKNYEKRKK